jgi:D-2-hydroxyglutarate dehydrogenase
MPLDLGAKGSCVIGGNISTNAGGIKFIKYGSMHSNTIGLTAVLGNGEIMTDYDLTNGSRFGKGLKHMLIGSEGTLGVITECAI